MLRSDEQDLVHTGRITPVHPGDRRDHPRTIRELVWRAIEQLGPMDDPIPEEVRAAESLTDRDRALRWIHFPTTRAELDTARERLKFDELFTLELGVAFRRQRLQAERTGRRARCRRALTDALPRSVAVRADRRPAPSDGGDRPAHGGAAADEPAAARRRRFGQDAGRVARVSGRGAVRPSGRDHGADGGPGRSAPAVGRPRSSPRSAPCPSWSEAKAGPPDQGSLFAERRLREPSMTYALLTGSVTGHDRERILKGAAEGSLDLLVGTHALVQEGVTFADLSLAVVDEQHRFGLHQRTALKRQGRWRHRRGDHDRHPDPADPRPDVLRRPGRRDRGRDARRPAADPHRSPRAPRRTAPPPKSSSATRWPPGGRRSSSARRSTRGTAPR